MHGCWFSFDNRMSKSASYIARSKEGDNGMNEEERRKKMIRVAQGVKRYTKGYEEESVIPNDQRAADSALMSSHNDK